MIAIKGTTGFGAVLVAVLMFAGAVALPAGVSAGEENLTDELQTETGPTSILGGGDHFFVKFGDDAAFGIVWGTESNPNNVYFVAVKARYLGYAQVYDDSGNLVVSNHSVKIATLYAVKLSDILEFNDSDGSGVLQYVRTYQGGQFTGGYMHLEDIYKKVDLNTSWTRSEVVEDSTDDSRTWTFDLTASNLPYVPLDNYTDSAGDGVLNSLKLTFHLEARMMQMDNISIPQWRVTVAKGMMGNQWWFTGVAPMEPKVVSGDVITYHVKWDQLIEGWDYDAANSDPRLLMELEAIVGNYIPPALAQAMNMHMMMYTAMIRAMNENGRMICTTNTGETTVNETSGPFGSPSPLTSPALTFGGERTRIGRLEWVSNVTVDGVPEMNQVRAQVMAGVPVVAVGANGALFSGFAAVAGLTFPGGGLIDHDPTFSSDALVNIGEATGGQLPLGLLGFVAIGLAALVVIVIVLVLRGGRKPGETAQQTYDRSGTTDQRVDWTKYYGKK
ncbi:MAG: hypothetical protein QXJ32_03550 [Thermoplasmata archaeon]